MTGRVDKIGATDKFFLVSIAIFAAVIITLFGLSSFALLDTSGQTATTRIVKAAVEPGSTRSNVVSHTGDPASSAAEMQPPDLLEVGAPLPAVVQSPWPVDTPAEEPGSRENFEAAPRYEASDGILTTTDASTRGPDASNGIPTTADASTGGPDASNGIPTTADASTGGPDVSDGIPTTADASTGGPDASDGIPNTTDASTRGPDASNGIPTTADASTGGPDASNGIPTTADASTGGPDVSDGIPTTADASTGGPDASDGIPNTTDASTQGTFADEISPPQLTEQQQRARHPLIPVKRARGDPNASRTPMPAASIINGEGSSAT